MLINKNNSKKRTTWRDCPKIINKIPNSKDKMILYVDESGEINKKISKKSLKPRKITNHINNVMIYIGNIQK